MYVQRWAEAARVERDGYVKRMHAQGEVLACARARAGEAAVASSLARYHTFLKDLSARS